MKNPLIIFAAIAVVAVLGIGAYAFSQNPSESDSMMKKDAEVMRKDPSTSPGQAMTGDKMSESRYVEYSKSALDSTASNRRVLFFYASWCPTCKPTDADLSTNSSRIPADVTVLRVNYNDPETDEEEKDLAKKYSITYQHTFVQIDGQGKEVTSWNGGKIDELLAKIK